MYVNFLVVICWLSPAFPNRKTVITIIRLSYLFVSRKKNELEDNLCHIYNTTQRNIPLKVLFFLLFGIKALW